MRILKRLQRLNAALEAIAPGSTWNEVGCTYSGLDVVRGPQIKVVIPPEVNVKVLEIEELFHSRYADVSWDGVVEYCRSYCCQGPKNIVTLDLVGEDVEITEITATLGEPEPAFPERS